MSRLLDAWRRFGALDGTTYLLHRLLQHFGGDAWGAWRYRLVAQPVVPEPRLPPRRGKRIVVEELPVGDPRRTGLPRPAAVLAARDARADRCFAAFKDAALCGFIWLATEPYPEDEVRVVFHHGPRGQTVWDYDVWVAPEQRTGLAFARLWDTVNAVLHDEGVRWSLSRIAGTKPESLAAHARLGAAPIGWAWFLNLGGWQLMVANRRSRLAVSAPGRAPALNLQAPP